MSRNKYGLIIILIVLLGMRFVNGGISDPKEYVLSLLVMLPGIITLDSTWAPFSMTTPTKRIE